MPVVAPPTLTAAPATPDRADRATYSARSIAIDDFIKNVQISELQAALNNVFANATEVVAIAALMNLNATTDTSASSVLIGSGAKSFTVSAGKSFVPGMWLSLSDTAAPSTNSMVGQVTSYAGTALVVNVPTNAFFGSGTKTAWTISLTSALSTGISAAMAPVASAATLAAGRAALGVSSIEYMHARDEKTSGTGAGASSVGDNIRVLNTVVSNTITGASLASNQITLLAGTYRVRATAPALLANSHRLRLRNVTDSSNILIGPSAYNAAADVVQTVSEVTGRFTIAATKVLNLTHYIANSNASTGLGTIANDGAVEVYASIEIWKE